nr:reverse transcriptase [Tanacetum cinerariifolium]
MVKELLDTGVIRQSNSPFSSPIVMVKKKDGSWRIILDNRILLKEGVTSVNISPYRYPPTQKDAIEAMVKELLDTGVIRQSNSPFFSPIVMVKKKDGSWRIDNIFLSLFWQSLFKMFKVQLCMSTAYHPQSDAQNKVVNKSVETYLRCLTMERLKELMKWLSLAEYWYNTNFYNSIKTTLFEVLYGQTSLIHTPYVAKDSSVELVDRTLQAREQVIPMLKFHLKAAQDRMKSYAEKKRSDRNLQQEILVTELQNQNNGQMVGGNLANRFNRYGRLTKLEFPRFNGDDVKGWIYRCNQFFHLDNVVENHKVGIASIYLYDKALDWHRNFERRIGLEVT